MRRFFKQLELIFVERGFATEGGTRSPSALLKTDAPQPRPFASLSERPIHLRGCDRVLEQQARELLRALGADKLACEVRVEWNPRLKTCAGRADHREKLISLNPLLRGLGFATPS